MPYFQFINENLYFTKTQQTFEDVILDNYEERWDNFKSVLPSETPKEHFTLLSLWGKFTRLPSKYTSVEPYTGIISKLKDEISSLSNEQVKEAINLFDFNYWNLSFSELSRIVSETTINDHMLFESVCDLADDLDCFGLCLAYATNRGLEDISTSSKWHEYEGISNLFHNNKGMRTIISPWIQSVSMLINEQIDDVNYDISYACSFWSEMLDKLVEDEADKEQDKNK